MVLVEIDGRRRSVGLLNRRLRAQAGLVIESGEPREVMHFCLLMGFGANAVNPEVRIACFPARVEGGEIFVELP